MTFDTFGLSAQMIEALKAKGFEEATSIQALAIPRLMQPGPALAAKARTGTGKTAAFGIPLIEALRERPDPAAGGEWIRGQVRALVLVPTRELAIQVAEEISSLRGGDRPRIATVYGGASMLEQLKRLASGVDIVVGTPGRVLDHLKRGSLDISRIGHFVLDEADEMLDMGFIEDIEAVMGMMPATSRVVLFSATLARPVIQAVRARVGEIEIIEDSSATLTTELAEQLWIEVRERDRLEALSRIIDEAEDFFGIVFVSTKVESDRVAKSLTERGYDAEALNGDMTQEARERVLGKFRDRRVQALVATDVAARGIDIEKLTHVINWSLPHDADSYLHRVGRTGRAGNSGTAITFVTPEEYRKLFRIRQVSGSALKKAKVPGVEGLIAAKKERLAARIEAAQIAGTPDMWLEMADSLLSRMDAKAALAAALSEGFRDEIDPSKYREIQEIQDSSVDRAGVSRLFIAAGKRDRLSARALVDLVKGHTGLQDRQIGSVEIYDTYSFLTVPYKAAQRLLDVARTGDGFPHTKLATPRGPGGGDRGGPGDRADGAPGAPGLARRGKGGYTDASNQGGSAPWRKKHSSNAFPTSRKGGTRKP